MIWLAVHMWALLFAAFLIGIGIGWWIWGASENASAPPRAGDTPMGTLDLDYDPAADASERSR